MYINVLSQIKSMYENEKIEMITGINILVIVYLRK